MIGIFPCAFDQLWTMSGRSDPSSWRPTATTPPSGGTVTASRLLESTRAVVGFALGTTLQVVPLKCSVNVALPTWPTAQMSLAEAAEIPFRELFAGARLATMDK